VADEDLQRLAREADADPADEAVARRLEQGLRRAGQVDALRARFRFKFLCPLRYEDLAPTDDPLMRACGRCARVVVFVRDPAELAREVARGSCVAFERRALEQVVAGLADQPGLDLVRRPGTPCVVATDLPFVDLDAAPRPPAADALPPGVARQHRAVPVERPGGGVLRVAFATPPTQGDLASVAARAGAARVEPVLAEPAAVDRALDRLDPREVLMGDLFGDV
jgi:hypothetical protein